MEDSQNSYRFFKPRTPIPEKTVSFEERAETEKAFAKFGLPLEQISGFYRLDDYRNNLRYVGRDFNPVNRDYGRFFVNARRHPSNSGYGRVASRPAMEMPEIVMEIKK